MSGDADDAEDPGWEDPETDHIRGWISPDDRLWRHPSELSSGDLTSGTPALHRPARRVRMGPWAAVGTCTLGALLVSGIVILATAYSTHRDLSQPVATSWSVGTSPTTEPGAEQLTGSVDPQHLVSSVQSSLVALVVTGPSGTTWGTGIVAESGGIVATTASTLAGATSVTSIDLDGQRQPANLVGIDRASGIAVLRIGDDLPVAPFDTGDLPVGAMAAAVALGPGGVHGAPIPAVYAGTVSSSGTAVDADAVTSTFAATAVSTPLTRRDAGCALLDMRGNVDGILETTMFTDGHRLSVFLPAELVLGVTRQLVGSGTVSPGWMGVDVSDTPSAGAVGTVSTSAAQPAGSVITAVVPGGAASVAGLEPGDVILSVDGEPVQSMAELRTRLYADGAGTALEVTARRSAGVFRTVVVLTGSVNAVSTTSSVGSTP